MTHGVARSDDPIDRAERRLARGGVGVPTVGERSDGLGATGDEDGIDVEQPGGAEQHGVDRPRSIRRRRDDDLGHAGRPGRDDGHDERRRVGRRPARHVAADAVERQPATLDLDAGHDRRPTCGWTLRGGKPGNMVDRLLEGRAIGGVEAVAGSPQLAGGRR